MTFQCKRIQTFFGFGFGVERGMGFETSGATWPTWHAKIYFGAVGVVD